MEKFFNKRVFVTATDNDDFANDFSGVVTGSHGSHLCVRDADDDVWCVLPSQVEILDD